MINMKTTDLFVQQVRAKRREEKEKKEYNISWGCEKPTEKGNKRLGYLAGALFIIPIIMIAFWWEYVTETGDLGVFFGGYGLFPIAIILLITGLIMGIVSASYRAKCREKTLK